MPKFKLTLDQFLKAYSVDKTIEQVAMDLGVAISTVRRCLKRFNIERKDSRWSPHGENHPCWTGYGEIPGRFFKRLYNGAISRAIKCDITIEYIWNLFLEQERKCTYTGTELRFGSDFLEIETTASVDRIDPQIDYTVENVQWVHKTINKMKSDLTDEEFINWCRKVVEYVDKKEI
jgi:predicted transcriptional regulator